MELKNIRIDSRLIHGQVATAWLKELNPNRIVVVDDDIIKDKLAKNALKMASPSTCKLSIINVERCLENMKNDKYENERVFMIAKNPITLLNLYEGGFTFGEITVGNIAASNDSRQILKSVSLTKEYEEAIKKLSSYGVEISHQMVPGDKKVDLMEKLS